MIYKGKSDVLMCDLMGIRYDFKTGRFFRGNGRETFTVVNNGTRVAMVAGERMSATRFAWLAFWDREPIGQVRAWNGNLTDVRILNLYETGSQSTTIFDEVWYDPYGGLIFRKDTNRELFVDRNIEYIAKQSWSKWKLVEALGHKPQLMIEIHSRLKWVVKYRGRIVAKRFQSFEEAKGWVVANNHAY